MQNLKRYRIKKIEVAISKYKNYLKETDYLAIKFAEGILTAEEYAETKALRESWRAEINLLEQQLMEE